MCRLQDKVVKKHILRFHVDDKMSSNLKPKVNDKMEYKRNHNYVKYGEVKGNIGKLHEYL